MLAHDDCTFAPPAGHVRLPACPQCGDMLLAPLLAEHVNAATSAITGPASHAGTHSANRSSSQAAET